MAGAHISGTRRARQSAGNDPSTGGLDTLGLLGTNGKVSRRSVLGAAVAIPFLPVRHCEEGSDEAIQPSPDSVAGLLRFARNDAGAWHRALAAYRAAEGAVEEAGRLCSVASRDEIGAAEDAFGDRLEALYGALRRLLVVPAPDLGAFLVKVDAAFEHEIATLWGAGPCVAAIREDVRRFGRGQSV